MISRRFNAAFLFLLVIVRISLAQQETMITGAYLNAWHGGIQLTHEELAMHACMHACASYMSMYS